jgi:hypothetical protein
LNPVTVALVACCATKTTAVGLARDVYCSPLFRMSLAYAERVLRASTVLILSAKLGAVSPYATIEPYDESLRDFDPEDLAEWKHTVGVQIERDLGKWAEKAQKVHAARFHPEQLKGALTPAEFARASARWRWVHLAPELYLPDLPVGAKIERPLAGMQIGRRLQFLRTELERAGIERDAWSGRAA